MASSINIEECSLEDIVQKGTLKDLINKLKKTPVSLDDENYHDYYLLIAALSKGQTEIADFLISNGFRVYKKVKALGEKTPLHYTTKTSNYELTQMLLLNGATLDITTVDEDGRTPLHIAINREDLKIINLMISNAKDTVLDDMFLYHYAVQNYNLQLVQLLLKKGLLPIRKNIYNETPFCLAVKKGLQDILYVLWKSFDLIMKSNPDRITLLGLMFVAVIMGDKDSISEILELDNSELNLSIDTTIKPCEEGWALFDYFNGFSLLHCAVKHVQPSIVRFLLDNCASVEIQDATGSSPLHIALEIKKEIADKDNFRYKINEYIIDSIIYATEREHLNLVNKYGISHFHVICTRNDEIAVTNYILNGASVSDSVHLDSPIYTGFAPLHFATKYMCRKTIKILLEYGADLEQEAYYKMSPLHIAARESSLQIVKLLIKHGADITKQDCDGNTPVHYAFQAKNYEILDFLLTVHAIINANPVNSAGISHFHIACTRHDLSIVAGFLRNGASVNDCVPLDPNIHYLHHNDDINWRGCSPLHFAAAFNRREIVQFLLEQNANVEICDAKGFTPFHIACQYTYEKFEDSIEDYLTSKLIVEEMDMDYGEYDDKFIDVVKMEMELKLYYPYDYYNLYDDDDKSQIVDWSSNRIDQINIFKLLIEYNSDVNKIDKFGNGALFYICYFNLRKILTTMSHTLKCKNIIRILLLKSLMKEMCFRRKILLDCLSKGVLNMEQCYQNGSILHFVAVDREYSDIERLEIMEIFLKLGANVNATNEKKQTPLHLATLNKDVKTVEILLAHNADVNCTEAQNSATPLHIATSLHCMEIVDLLLMKEADINAKESNGKTPLHILLTKRYDNYSEFKLIFYHYVSGADVNVPDKQGKTPLHVACETISPEVVEDLLMFGADMTAADCNGETIFQCVYRQLKSIITAFGKLEDDLFEIFWTLYIHALKLFTIGLISEKAHMEISQKFIEIKKLSNYSLSSYQNQELNDLVSKCHQEIEIFRNTEIHNDVSAFDLLFEGDHEMIKYVNNSNLKAIIESDSFDETYCCYGYLLKLRFIKGLERSELLPKAKYCLSYLTNARLPECFSENILVHLNNNDLREFIRVVPLVKFDKQISPNPTPSKIIKDCTKYFRVA